MANRSARWNASARRMMRSSDSGRSGAKSRGAGIVPDLTCSSTALPLPWNSGRAHTSSNSTMPAANTSLRQSTGSPRACSGDMYAYLPLMTPSSSSTSRARAIPKSTIFTLPSHDRRMFWGDTSRCTMPSGWPNSSVLRCA